MVLALGGLCGAARADDALPVFDLATARLDTPEFTVPDLLLDLPSSGVLIAAAGAAPEEPTSFGDRYFRRILVPELGPYSTRTFMRQAKSVPLELSAFMAYPIYEGLTKWGWGKSSFHVHSEGWFGKDTRYLGVDKLGHAYGTYLYSDLLTQRIAQKNSDRAGAAITGSLLGFGIQFSSEIGDGFAPDQGFSPQDIVFNGLGAGFSFLRNTVPGLADKLDYRMEYLMPSEFSGFAPQSDYSGQKYVLALKLGGFEQFEETPLRFFELHAGYFARGVGQATVGHGVKRRREPYIGIGFNLKQLLAETPVGDSTPGLFADRFLEYYQPPYTYFASRQK
jgi:hypothetical protein